MTANLICISQRTDSATTWSPQFEPKSPTVFDPMTFTVDGPQADEADTDPNPFTDYRFTASFTNINSGVTTTSCPATSPRMAMQPTVVRLRGTNGVAISCPQAGGSYGYSSENCQRDQVSQFRIPNEGGRSRSSIRVDSLASARPRSIRRATSVTTACCNMSVNVICNSHARNATSSKPERMHLKHCSAIKSSTIQSKVRRTYP